MKSVNKVLILGNVGKAPEIKYLATGTAVATFSVACNERFKGKDGEWADRTEWVNIKAWARLAEIVEQYVHKGSQIYIEGRLQTNSWDDKETGQKRYKTEVVANDIVLLGGKDDRKESSDDQAPEGESDDDVPF